MEEIEVGDRTLRAAWVSLLERYSFDHVADLTFKFARCSIDFAFSRLQQWTSGLSRIAQKPIAWAAFPESTHEELVHLHALLAGTDEVPPRVMTERWKRRNGLYLRIEPYEEDRGAEWYVTKRVSARFSEGRFSSNFQRVATPRS